MLFWLSSRLTPVVLLFSFSVSSATVAVTPSAIRRANRYALACANAFPEGRPRLEPIARFDALYDIVEERLIGQRSYDQIIEALDSRRVRQTLLYLQALLKIYERMPSSSANWSLVVATRRDIKSLEDTIGQLQRAEDVLKRSRKGGASLDVVAALELEYEDALKTASAALRDSQWAPFPIRRLNHSREALRAYEFLGKKKDQREQVKALIDLVRDYRRDLARMGSYFEPAKFTMHDLEEGLHSARRAIRWISATIAASDGLYVYRYDANPSNETAELEASYANRKYLALGAPMKGAIELPWHEMLVLAKFIVEFGALKDFKESQLDLADVLQKHGLARSADEAEKQAYEIMRNRFGDVDVEAHAKELYQDYLRRDPLKKIKSALKEGLESTGSDFDFYERWIEQERHLPPPKRINDGDEEKAD